MVTANDYSKEDEPILRQAVENYLKEIEKIEDKKRVDGLKQQHLDYFKKKPEKSSSSEATQASTDTPNYDTEIDSSVVNNAGSDDDN